MTARPAGEPVAAQVWPEQPLGFTGPLEPLVGNPRDRPAAGALPTDVDRFRELVWEPLAAADPSGRRWLAALGGFELLRHGAAEPGGVLHATGRSVASMLGVAETTWCRSTRQGQIGYGPLLDAAGLLVRVDWERYQLPAWDALQNRAADAALRGRFVYTHRPSFRATVVRWRLEGVSLAALGAWSLLRYCHTRWDTAELPMCDAAIARELGVKPHTWAGWAGELAGCGALQRLRPTAGSGWRLPLYFALRTGRGLDQAVAATRGEDHAEAAVQVHATSAAGDAEPAAGVSDVRAREDPVGDGGVKEHPGAAVERALERLAAVAGDAWQQEQIRTSATLRARCAELLERTGWSPQRLAAELTGRELRTAREPVRVLAYRARVLLDAAPIGGKAAPTPVTEAGVPPPPDDHDHPAPPADDLRRPEPNFGELDVLNEPARHGLLEAARARLRRIGLPRTGEFADDHPLLRGEALNLLRQRHAPTVEPEEAAPVASETTPAEVSPVSRGAASNEPKAAQPQRHTGPLWRPSGRIRHRPPQPRSARRDVFQVATRRPRGRAPPRDGRGLAEGTPTGLGRQPVVHRMVRRTPRHGVCPGMRRVPRPAVPGSVRCAPWHAVRPRL